MFFPGAKAGFVSVTAMRTIVMPNQAPGFTPSLETDKANGHILHLTVMRSEFQSSGVPSDH